MTRDEALAVPLMNGTFVGLDLANARGRAWLEGMFRRAETGLFQGPYFTGHAPAELRARKPGKTIGYLSRDRRVWGHRHDEAVGTCLAWRMGMAVTRGGDLFANGTRDASPSAIIRTLR
jgi:hypothetical protein